MGLGFLFKATDEASPVMQGVSSNLAKAQASAEAAQKSMKQMGEGFNKVATVSTVAGAALGGGLALATNEAAKFQFGVAQVATEADKAKLPAAEIARIAKQMATTYGGDLDTQIKALYQGVAAGADDASKSVSLLDAANRLAVAGNTDQATAILGITKVLNNYGMGFDHATEVSDAFFVAVKNGQTTVGELGNAIGEVAAVGKNAGASMEELIGALGTAATLGKDTASSAAGLKAALAGIAHPTADAAAEAAKLGIKFNSVELRSKGLVGFLQEITGSSKYTADSMGKLFGSLEGSAFMSQVATDHMSALTAMMGGMKQKAGGSQEAFELMSQTMQQTGSIMKANVQVALVSIGEAFIPVITGATRMVSAIVKGFNSLPDSAKKGIAMALAITAAALLLAGAVGGIVGALLTAELPLMVIGGALAGMAQIMLPLIVVGGILIGTIVALRRAFEENVGGLRDTVLPLLEKVKLTWNALSQAFSQGGFSGAVRDELAKAENQGIKNFVVNLFSWVARIQNFFDGVQKGFARASDQAGPTFAKFAQAIERLVGVFGKLFGGKQDPQKAASAFDKFGEAGGRVGAVIERIAEVLISGLTYGMDVLSSFMTTLGNLGPDFDGLWNSVKLLWGALGTLFDAFGQLGSAFGTGGSSADATGSKFASFIGTVANVITYVALLATLVVGALSGAFKGLAEVVEIVRTIIVGAFHSIVDAVLETVGLIAKAVDKVGSLVGKNVGASKGLSDIGTKMGLGARGFDPDHLMAAPPAATPGATASTPVATPALTPLPQTTPQVTAAPTLASLSAQAALAGPGAAGGGGAGSPEQVGAAVASAMKANPTPPPIIHTVFQIDGEKVAEAMSGRNGTNAARNFTPSAAPSG